MSDIEQFMQQPFVGPVFSMMCFFGILLVVVIVGIVIARQRRAQRRTQEAAPAPSYYGADMSGMDMPDLDSLVSVPTAPAVKPAAAPVQAAVMPQAAPPARAARKGTFTVTLSDGPATEAVEVMSILRDVVDGTLIVQMGDRTYQNINSDTDFKERFNKIMRELAQVVKAPTSAPAPAAPAETAAASEPVVTTDAPGAEVPDVAAPGATAPQPPLAAPPPVVTSTPNPTGMPLPGDLPKFTLDDQSPLSMFRRGQKQEKKPVPEINIAGAIEAYLQYKLRNTPAYAGRSIHVYPSPDGGVSIEVDGQYFDAVGDVTDPGVREFLATTIQEWQERH
jgi:hypothetical protein